MKLTLAAFLIATPLTIHAEDPDWQQQILRARQLQQAANYAGAESILTRTIAASPDDYARARTLAALGSVYQDLGRLADAERSYLRAIDAGGEVIEPINGLASLYYETRQYAKAEKLTLRCLALLERQDISGGQLTIAQQLGNLAALYQAEHKYPEAEKLYLRALVLFEHNGSANTPENAFVLHNLASLRMAAGKPEQAAGDSERAIAIWEATLGPAHPVYAQGLADLAHLNALLGRPADSEALWNRSLAIVERTLGPTHPTYGRLLQAYAGSLDRWNRKAEAKRFRQRAESILTTQSSGPPPGLYTVDYRELPER
jgi:tetratricopeptide (TPR) repeat protein